MSNSSLVTYTKISPNKTSPRNHTIDTITIHCTAGQCRIESLGNLFADPKRRASSNYGISYDGKIGLFVDEKDRSWCSSNSTNDNRAITIEVASDSYHPYVVKPAAYRSLINLLVDICKRNNIKELKWKADKSLIGQVDKQNMTVHRWFANKACPGDYLYNLHGQIAAEVNLRLNRESSKPSKPANNTPYRVKNYKSGLEIRTGPGLNYAKAKSVVPIGVYTIVEESNGWGKLKSGAGWIQLDKVKKL